MSVGHTMIGIVMGIRPELIKLAPLIKECIRRGIPIETIYTNQHYDDCLSSIFQQELGLQPDHIFKELKDVEHFFEGHKFDLILVLGDSDTSFFTAFYAKRNRIPVGHIEAGLRCYAEFMYEENNRILIDHISKYRLAPTQLAVENLRAEGLGSYLVGNVIVDVLAEHNGNTSNKDFVLVTLHRRENLNNINNIFKEILSLGEDVIFPLHPHTKKYLAKKYHKYTINPVGYEKFISYLSSCRYVLTDSGGIQEESCILHKPCVTLRESTERPETLELNNVLVEGHLKAAINDVTARSMDYEQPYGENASAKIVDFIVKKLNLEE